MNKYTFIQVINKKTIQRSFFFVFLFIVIPASNCFSDDSDVFPIQQAMKAWNELKKGISSGYMADITTSSCRLDDKEESSYKKKVLKKGDMELVEHNSIRVVGKNKDYSFTLKKKSKDVPWILENMAQPNNPLDENLGIILGSADVFEGIMVETTWIEKLVLSDSFKILSSKKSVDKEGNEIFLITFECLFHIDEINQILGGSLYFDPNRYWILTKYEIKGKSLLKGIGKHKKDTEGIIKKTFEYQDLDNYPFPKKIICEYESKDFPSDCVKTEYSRLTRNVNQNEFYLSHYGFSEPSHPTQRGDVIRIILIVVGAIMILVSLFMKFLTKRMK
jgi:hypothetical protein